MSKTGLTRKGNLINYLIKLVDKQFKGTAKNTRQSEEIFRMIAGLRALNRKINAE